MTTLESFNSRTEGLPKIRSIPGPNDYPGVVVSQDRMIPWSRFIPGQNDSPGVVLSQDRMTPMESFYPRTQ